jgi:voltage-gated potassium channel Kch
LDEDKQESIANLEWQTVDEDAIFSPFVLAAWRTRRCRWLILVDDNFLRLVAPAYNYERLITHDLKACSQVAWVN